ncbi:Cytochrome P450 52A11 [Cytospora mali]|uniref:Cytochrome P450 52A11 n=1 Tax=Cytospora mali TaxID=578113 RepID=A0A194VJ76_CYTMA|nr:Cytochrome P450 52A11 [Valsa mali]
MFSILILIVCLGCYLASRILLRVYQFSVSKNRKPNNIPRLYPHIDPFLGLDLAVQTWRDFHNGELSEGLRRRHALYGRTFLTNNLGSDYIYTVEPENIRAITTAQFSNFGKSEWVSEAAKHVGNGVLMNEGEAWRQSRAMLKPVFARTVVDEPTFMEPHVMRLVGEMKRLGGREDGEEVFDFHELACMFTLDVVTEFLFGKSTRCMGISKGVEGEEGMKFLSLVRKFEGPSGEFIAVGLLAWLELLPSYRHLIGLVTGMKEWFHRKLDEIMAESSTVSAPKTPRSVFTAMKAAGHSGDQIQGELQNVFFASYDTTSAFLANLIYVLVRYPDVQARLREEVDSLCGRSPSNHDLSKLEYLRLVIMEALRLYSPVSSHSRTAKADTILPRGGGPEGRSPIIVRAGATVIWSTYSLNRDPERYGEDWAEFRPERWTSLMRSRDTTSATSEGDGDIVGGNTTCCATEIGAGKIATCRHGEGGESWRGFFMPFGSGPRTCLGQQMVQTEVSYVVVRLLQEFSRLGLEGGGKDKPFREARAVSLYNSDGVRISVR